MAKTTGYTVAISDKDQIIASAGDSRKELISKKISSELEEVIEERSTILAKSEDKNFILITNNGLGFAQEVISPIISEGDVIGSVAILSKDTKKSLVKQVQLTETAASFREPNGTIRNFLIRLL